MFILRPGSDYRMKTPLSAFPDMYQPEGNYSHLRPGTYHIRLTYVVWDSIYAAEFMAEFPVAPDALFVGQLESNEVLLKIK